tara:strand:- start:32328 stop:32525 length:198 start_codon:yes stop_codon:yes gene_type:complete
MTDLQRRFVLAVYAAPGEEQIFANATVASACLRAGWVDCDAVYLPMIDRRWSVTPDGIAAVEVVE